MTVLFKHFVSNSFKVLYNEKRQKNQLANSGECVERCKLCVAVSITDI